MHHSSIQRGFTMVELIMVIVIMGVIGGMVSVFMKSPIDAYIASGRRATLTDVADTTVRRMARDIRKALPNSIRVSNTCIEFIPTKTGGRYRIEDQVAGDDTSLDFSKSDATFNMLGSNAALPADQRILAGDVIVVYNLGIPDSDAYQLTGNVNRAVVGGANPISESGTPLETAIQIAPTQFLLASGGNRFHVVPSTEHVVSYVCITGPTSAGDDATGTLYRYARKLTASYLTPTCPASLADMPSAVVLAQNVSVCSLSYDPASQRNAIVQVTLGLTLGGETVKLYQEVHVDNTP